VKPVDGENGGIRCPDMISAGANPWRAAPCRHVAARFVDGGQNRQEGPLLTLLGRGELAAYDEARNVGLGQHAHFLRPPKWVDDAVAFHDPTVVPHHSRMEKTYPARGCADTRISSGSVPLSSSSQSVSEGLPSQRVAGSRPAVEDFVLTDTLCVSIQARHAHPGQTGHA